jgi:hypothetical protein
MNKKTSIAEYYSLDDSDSDYELEPTIPIQKNNSRQRGYLAVECIFYFKLIKISQLEK